MEAKKPKPAILNDKQASGIYYMLPFTSRGKEVNGDLFKIDEHLVLRQMNTGESSADRVRKLVRSDIKRQIDGLSIYSLIDRRSGSTASLSITSYKAARKKNADGSIIKFPAIETNLGEIVKVRNLYIYRFDNDNQFLVLLCTLDDQQAEHGRPIDECINAHAHIVNNYFKTCDGFSINKEAEKIDISKDNLYFDAFLEIVYSDETGTYPYRLRSSEQPSIEREGGIRFNFETYQIRVLSQMMIIDTSYQEEERCLIAQQLARGSRSPELLYEESIFKARRFLSVTTPFGTSLVYWKEKDEPQEYWESRNKATVTALYGEYLFGFLFALNYHIRIEKKIDKVGRLDLDAKNSKGLEMVREEILNDKRDTAKYYFINISRFDYVNAWYRSVVKGFDTDALDEELETKLRYSSEYLDSRIRELVAKENKGIETFIAFIAVAGNVALFVIALISLSTVFESISTPTIVALILSGIILALSVIFGIFLVAKRHRIRSKYGIDHTDKDT